MPSTDCLNVPECIWIEIFDHLDAQSLLRVTETCQLFANMFNGSLKLRNKIRIKVDTNNNVALQLKTLMSSQRSYRNLFFGCDETVFNRNNQVLESSTFDMIRNMFGENITNLKLKNIYMKMNSIIELLKSFVNLKSCYLEKILMSDHSNFYYHQINQRDREILENNFFPFAQLQELVIRKTDFFCFYFFQNANKLKKLIVSDLAFDKIDVQHFENFCVKQNNLKELRLHKFRENYLFKTGTLASPTFQLEVLSINSVYWNDNDNAIAFFKSQRNIKTLWLALKNRWNVQWDEMMWFNDILKYIFSNKNLKNVVISTKEKHGYNIKSCDFLQNIVCPKVTSLTYYKGLKDETTALMEIFVKMFPNVKYFTFNTEAKIRTPDLSFLSSWKCLESLDIKEEIAYLKDIHAPNLKSFDYVPFRPYTDGLRKDISGFIDRHPNIRHFKLCFDTYGGI